MLSWHLPAYQSTYIGLDHSHYCKCPVPPRWTNSK